MQPGDVLERETRFKFCSFLGKLLKENGFKCFFEFFLQSSSKELSRASRKDKTDLDSWEKNTLCPPKVPLLQLILPTIYRSKTMP